MGVFFLFVIKMGSKSKKDRKSKEKKDKKRKRSSSTVDSSSEPSAKKQKLNNNSTNQNEVDQYREKNQITIELGSSTKEDIAPVLSFDKLKEDFPDTSSLIDAFCKTFTSPTPIQAQCWPIGLSGRDLIGIAETGSGKTLAFMLPGIVKTITENSSKPRKRQPSILVLSPTRELAMQSDIVCNDGGMDRKLQNQKLKQGAQVVVATPGRLISLVENNECDLSRVHYLVLDEADRMLDMGFEPDIKKIMSFLPK